MVELATDEASTCARVVGTGTEELVLACFEHLGDPTPPARIRCDASWLLEALYAAIQDLDLGRGHARLLFHPEEAAQADGSGSLSTCVGQLTAELNPGQAQAVTGALGSELSFLWGPPGCGKTTTLAALTEALLDADRSVLVLGPTNHAVDHLLMAVADRLSARGRLAPGDVLRVGPISSGALERAYGSHVDPQRATERLVDEALAGTIRPEDQLAAVADLLGRLE
ncbi:MAG TPA: AAA domain-containing protein, partial [Gemmatimonadota bacterium]|nr:AAA domain-containing protein [Gemmatimonadota bacterium]